MASPVEESFVYNEILKLPINSNILEFGCGENFFPNRVAKLKHKVTAIDLYDRDSILNTNIHFIKDDFENINLPQCHYDCIYALSSFEHIGLERDNIIDEKEIYLKTINILAKFKRLLKHNGILLLTLPFGDGSYKHYYVNNKGVWSKTKQPDSEWGAKVYDIHDLYIFNMFLLLKCDFYLKVRPDFFDINSWTTINYYECCCIQKEEEVNNAIVCLKLVNI